MEVDKDKLKKMILWLLSKIEKSEKELRSHQAMALALRQQFSDIDAILEVARGTTGPQVEAHYQKLREMLPSLFDAIQTDQDLEEFLGEWSPDWLKN